MSLSELALSFIVHLIAIDKFPFVWDLIPIHSILSSYQSKYFRDWVHCSQGNRAGSYREWRRRLRVNDKISYSNRIYMADL